MKQAIQPRLQGWGLFFVALFLVGSLLLFSHPQVERDFFWVALGFGGTFAGYLGFFFLVRSRAGKAIPPTWKWGGLFAAIILRASLLPAQPCDDIYRFAWEAKVERAGYSAFDLAPVSPELESLRDSTFFQINHPDRASSYPRLAQALFRLGFRESQDSHAFGPYIRWKSMIFLADVATIVLLAGLSWPVAMLFGLHPLLAFEGVGRGHYESFWLLACVAALLALKARKDALFGVLLALAISLKPMAILLVIPWIWNGAWKRWRSYFALFPIALSTLDAWATTGKVVQQFLGSTQYNSFLPGLWKTLFAPSKTHLTYWENGAFFTLLTLACVLGILIWNKRRTRTWSAERISLWLFGAFLFSSTVVHPWYALWILPFAALELNFFWLSFAGMQILGLWPYYRQSLGLPWHEIPGLKWLMLGLALGLWLVDLWRQKALPRFRLTGSQP